MDISQLKTPARTRKEKLMAFLPAGLWYAVIFAFSAQNGAESGKLSATIVRGSARWLGDLGELFRTDWDAFMLLSFLVRKVAHMSVFFVLTGLLLYGLWKVGMNLHPGMAAVGLCAVLAALDEFHQTFVPGRDGKLTDVLIDLSGGVCFLLFWQILSVVRRRRKTGILEKAKK